MIDFNLLHIFCKVAELGSFTKAARHLKQPKSRISRAIGRLEEDLNIQLIRRTTRQMTLTESGKKLFQKSFHLMESLRSEVNQIVDSRGDIAGCLKISAPEDFGLGLLSHLLPAFLEMYPDIQFELLFSNEYVDLVAEQVDIAFRLGPLESSSLIGRKLGTVNVILVASPQYLDTYGRPTQIASLNQYKLLDFQLEHDDEGILDEAFPEEKWVSCIKSNQFSMLRQLAVQHQGIATLPDFFAYHDLKSGNLERVLPNWATEPIDLHLLYPSTRQLPPKTRAFIDFAVGAIKIQLVN